MLPWLAKAATAYVEASGSDIPVALHLDHGPNFAEAKDCIEYGFSSVMYDGSHHPYDENVAEAKQVADFAHQHDVTVEADRKSTRLNSSHSVISYAVFCLKKKMIAVGV